MFTIKAAELTPVRADAFTESPAGEAAKIITEGVLLQPDIANVMPLTTHLQHLTSVGNRHVYTLSVRGWTVEQFIAIATAYAKEDFVEAQKLTDELRPKEDYIV